MIGSPLAGVLMRRSPWIALLTGLGLLVLSTIASFAVPETLHFNKPGDNLEAGSDQDDDLDTATLAPDPKDSELRKLIAKAREDLAEIWKFVIGNKDIAFLLISIVFVVLGKFVQEMLLQYASKRFGWSWDEVCMPLLCSAGPTEFTDMDVGRHLPHHSWCRQLGCSDRAPPRGQLVVHELPKDVGPG